MSQIAAVLQSDEGKALIQQQLTQIDAKQAAAAAASTKAATATTAEIGDKQTHVKHYK